MTTVVTLSEAARARADELIRSGRCTSFGEVVRAAMVDDDESWMDEPVDLDTLSSEDRAAVEEGLADIEAGRVVDADVVFDRLIAKYKAMAVER